ncbi:MAG: hypothetical protein AVDCRST_MAG19-3349 [uncultured Thermomicrobiales bacterium]|uniref:Uncharacterized protein n=1 Tax=uncultured Thermomicrobiales bacterium TaxID=1645740 RepID=A0A6J4VK59_9BACT|nr:MAG: hypothetical protein AVDCRST_MAG19-3349 [uncultured Thermomicrobiales bacterium]
MCHPRSRDRCLPQSLPQIPRTTLADSGRDGEAIPYSKRRWTAVDRDGCGRPELQNRAGVGDPGAGGFDSHAPSPPALVSQQ